MAIREALWISSGSVTQLDSTSDGLAVNEIDTSDGQALTIGNANATAIEFGSVGIDSVSGALTIGGSNASSIEFGANIDKDANEALIIGGSNATVVQFGANIDKDAAEALVIGGSNATAVQFGAEIDADAAEALVIGATNATSVQVDGIEITGSTIDTVGAGTLTIGGAGSTATAIEIGTAGELTKVLGNFEVVGTEVVGGSATFNGNTDIGDTSADTLTITASVDQAINFTSGLTSHFTTTSGDLKIIPEGTTIAQGGLGVALSFTSYTTTNPVTNGVLTGVGTSFQSELDIGDAIEVQLAGGTEVHTVASITSDTVLEVDAPFASLEAGVTLGLTTDDNLFEVYSGDAKARLTVNKNGNLSATRGEEHAAILTLNNEEGGHTNSFYIHNTDPTGIISGTVGDVCLTQSGGTIYFNSGGGTVWTAVGSAGGDTLQQAYVAGASINITAGEGDLAFTASTADFTVTTTAGGDMIVSDDGAGTNFLATDHTNSQLELGHADITVGFLGDVDTDITFETATAPHAITLDSGALTVSTTTSGLLSLTGAGGITSTSTGGTYTVNAAGQTVDINSTILDVDTTGVIQLDGVGGSNFNTDSGNLTLAATTTGEVLVDGVDGVEINSASGAIDIGNDADAQAINVGTGAAARTITIGNTTGATGVAINSGTGNIALASTGTGDITINSDDTLLLDADGVLELNSTGGAINIGNDADAQNINVGTGASVRTITIGNATGATTLDLNSGTGGIALDSVSSNIDLTTNTSGNITLTPASGSDVVVTTAGAGGAVTINAGGDGGVDINATAGGITLDAVGTSNFTVAGDNLTLSTTTSGTLAVTAADTLDLNAGGAAGVTIDATAGGVSIDAAGASNFTTSSGAIDIDSVGALSLNSSGAAINVGDDAVAQAINIGTGAAARTITMGNATGATALDLNAGTGGVSIDCTATGDIALTAADDATSDITFQAHGSAVYEFNEDGTNSDLVGFSAGSIIGALNELKADATEAALSRVAGVGGLTAGNAAYIDADDAGGANRVVKADADDATAAIVVGFAKTTASAGNAVEIITAGEVTVSTNISGAAQGQYVYLSGTAGEVTTTAPSTGTVLRLGVITDVGTGAGDGKVLIQIGTPVSL